MHAWNNASSIRVHNLFLKAPSPQGRREALAGISRSSFYLFIFRQSPTAVASEILRDRGKNRSLTFLNDYFPPKELDTKDAAPATEDTAAVSKRPGFSGLFRLQFPLSVDFCKQRFVPVHCLYSNRLCVLTFASLTLNRA